MLQTDSIEGRIYGFGKEILESDTMNKEKDCHPIRESPGPVSPLTQ